MWRSVVLFIMLGNNFACQKWYSEKKISLQPLPYFRRQIEEPFDYTSQTEPGRKEYPDENINNVLLQNAKVLLTPSDDDIEDNTYTVGAIINFNKRKGPKIGDVLDNLENQPEPLLYFNTNNKVNLFNAIGQVPDNYNAFFQEFKINEIYKPANSTKFNIDNLKNIQDFRNKIEFTSDVIDIVTKVTETVFHVEDTSDDPKNETFNSVNSIRQQEIDIINDKNLSYNLDKHRSLENSAGFDFEKRLMDLDWKYNLGRMISLFKTTIKTDVMRTELYPDTISKNYIGSDYTNVTNDSIDDIYIELFHKDVFHKDDVDPLPFFKDSKFFGPNSNKTFNIANRRKAMSKGNCSGIEGESSCIADDHQRKLSCIKCNNAAVDWCGSPKNKLIPSTICKQEHDLCYSLHTPFSIVDRGCYNTFHNMSTYVCACNLCNYIPFIDLPMIFVTKQKWIQNVYEMSHLRRMRRNSLKKLSCLKCSVDGTSEGDVIYNTNCFEGQIGRIKRVLCKEGEVCGVKAIRKQGYIWRGCVSHPLFNYYITLCNSDLCNYEPVASIYDTSD